MTAPDSEILKWAKEHEFVLITNDLDFSAVLAAGAVTGPSVIQFSNQDLLSDAAVSIVVDARQLCVARSEWRGRVTVPKGGRARQVPMTARLTAALQAAASGRTGRVLCDDQASSLIQRAIRGLLLRAAREAGVRPGVHILRRTFCSTCGDEGGARQRHSGACRSPRSSDDSALHAPESKRQGGRNSLLETDTRLRPVGEMVGKRAA